MFSISPLHSQPLFTGSVIATVFTKDTIQLFSDGRLLSTIKDSIESDLHSKVYKLSDQCGMVTGGLFFRSIHSFLLDKAQNLKLKYPDEFADIAFTTLKTEWEVLRTQGHFKNIKDPTIHLLIAGFDVKCQPRLFNIFAEGPEPVIMREEVLVLNATSQFSLLVKSAKGAQDVYTVQLIMATKHPYKALTEMAREAFNNTKVILSKKSILNGGATYESQLTKSGYKVID